MKEALATLVVFIFAFETAFGCTCRRRLSSHPSPVNTNGIPIRPFESNGRRGCSFCYTWYHQCYIPNTSKLHTTKAGGFPRQMDQPDKPLVWRSDVLSHPAAPYHHRSRTSTDSPFIQSSLTPLIDTTMNLKFVRGVNHLYNMPHPGWGQAGVERQTPAGPLDEGNKSEDTEESTYCSKCDDQAAFCSLVPCGFTPYVTCRDQNLVYVEHGGSSYPCKTFVILHRLWIYKSRLN